MPISDWDPAPYAIIDVSQAPEGELGPQFNPFDAYPSAVDPGLTVLSPFHTPDLWAFGAANSYQDMDENLSLSLTMGTHTPLVQPAYRSHDSAHTAEATTSERPRESHAKPKWLAPAKAHLEGLVESSVWTEAIDEWLSIEEMLGYPKVRTVFRALFMTLTYSQNNDKNQLGSESRPKNIQLWLKECNLKKALPPISSAEEYRRDWQAWWVSVQSEWRLNRRGGKAGWPLRRHPQPDEEDWRGIQCGNYAGIFAVLLSLGWWYQVASGGAKKNSAAMKDWRSALDDVLWVLQRLTAFLTVQ